MTGHADGFVSVEKTQSGVVYSRPHVGWVASCFTSLYLDARRFDHLAPLSRARRASQTRSASRGRTVPPSSVSRAFSLGSARPELISLLSFSTMSADDRHMAALINSAEPHHLPTGEVGPCATCGLQRRPERQIEKMIQRLFTNAIR